MPRPWAASPEAIGNWEHERNLIRTLQIGIADALAKEWLVEGSVRCYRCVYYHAEFGWRIAQILQRKGLSGFELGVIRDVSKGGSDQLRAYAMSSLEAVIWLGLQRAIGPITWEITL